MSGEEERWGRCRGEGRFYGHIRVLRHHEQHRQKIVLRVRSSWVAAGQFLLHVEYSARGFSKPDVLGWKWDVAASDEVNQIRTFSN